MLILNADEIRKVLPMKDAIEAMKQAYISLSQMEEQKYLCAVACLFHLTMA